MRRDELDARNSAAIRRWSRSMQDSGGVPPQGLTDELAQIADEHARQAVEAERSTGRASLPGTGQAAPAVTVPPPVSGKLPGAPEGPRRTPARRSAK